jgi:CRP-like cAMP-binding protein
VRLREREVRMPPMGGKEDPKLEALRGTPLFEDMNKKQLAIVGQIVDEIDFPAGKELIREGELGRQFFVLLDGEAEVRRGGHTVNTLLKGDFFGEISLLSDRRATATVTASTPIRAVVATRSSFKRLMRDDPDVQWKVVQALIKRVPGDGIVG